MRSNDGGVWLKYIYNYNGDEREELVYDENGKLNMKFVYKLDDKGNAIAEFEPDVLKIYGDKRYTIKYEAYDNHGNWTKAVRTEIVTENGKDVLRPAYINYRTITYYK
jgi:hypothetical protein